MKQFKKVYVEIASACNLACPFCPQTTRQKAFMKPEQFAEIAIQVAPIAKYVCLHVMGEPLLHPDLDKILDIAAQHNLSINITTNGTLLDKAKQVLLNHPCVKKVSISLHSLLENGFDNMQQSAFLKSILNFCALASPIGIVCELRFWNKNSATESYSQQYLKTIYQFFGLDFANFEELKTDKLANNVYIGMEERFEWPGLTQNEQNSIYCHALKTHFAILVNGDVVPCCLDYNGQIVLGNALKQPVNQILQGEQAVQIKKGFENRTAICSLCKHCSFARKF